MTVCGIHVQQRGPDQMRSHVGRCRRAYALSLCATLVVAVLVPPSSQGQLLPAFGRDRAGTSGFQFLKIAVDARGAALGETVVANAFDASALFWNPALAAQVDEVQIGLSHTAYFADVSVEYGAVTVPVRRLGLTLGASLHTLNSGRMDVTTEFQPFGTGESFRFVDQAFGVSVAQRLTDLFSYGVTGKFLREGVAGLTTTTFVFDIGIFYRIGTIGTQIGVAIRNFGFDGSPDGELSRTTIAGADPVVETEFESIPPPTTFLLGVTHRLLRTSEQHSLEVSGQLTNPNDNSESFNFGVEYVWSELLALRGGYRFGIDGFTIPSTGVGLILPDVFAGIQARFDYGLSHLDRLGAVHRIGLNLSI